MPAKILAPEQALPDWPVRRSPAEWTVESASWTAEPLAGFPLQLQAQALAERASQGSPRVRTLAWGLSLAARLQEWLPVRRERAL